MAVYESSAKILDIVLSDTMRLCACMWRIFRFFRHNVQLRVEFLEQPIRRCEFILLPPIPDGGAHLAGMLHCVVFFGLQLRILHAGKIETCCCSALHGN